MDKKIYKIARRSMGANNKMNEKNVNDDGKEYAKAVKGIMGVALIVVAAVFGGLVASLPVPIAFGIVFAYIVTQLLIWLK